MDFLSLSIILLFTHSTLIHVYFHLSTCPASTSLCFYPYSMLSTSACWDYCSHCNSKPFGAHSSLSPPPLKIQHVPMLVYVATGIYAAPHQTMSGNQCKWKFNKQKSSEPLSTVLDFVIFRYLHYYGISIKNSSLRNSDQPWIWTINVLNIP